MTDERFVYDFMEDLGTKDVLALCGGKGAGLMRMRRLGLPVPEGFIISTEACVPYMETGELPEGLMAEVMDNLRRARIWSSPASMPLTSMRSSRAAWSRGRQSDG